MAEMHPLRTHELVPSEVFSAKNKVAEELAKSCQQATVPSLDHLRMADYNVVYEPSDDTFLMLDALQDEFGPNCEEKKNRSLSIRNTLEIGSGTGVSTVFLWTLLDQAGNTKAKLFATDINKDAVRITEETAKANNMNGLEACQCDLATPLLADLKQKVDVLIFNPPYVPTPEEEVGSDSIEASWAGGKDGRVVFDRAVPQIANLLSWPHGAAYIIAVDDNKPEEIASMMMEKYGIKVVPLMRRRARNEFLTVLKFTLTREKVDA